MQKKVSPIDLTDSFEKIPVKIYPDLTQGSIAVAREIADLIREKQKKKSTCVLGIGHRFYSENIICRTGKNS